MSKGTAGKTFGTKAQFEETVKILMAAGAK
jgi:hypothetical protein